MGYFLLNYVDNFIGAEFQDTVYHAHEALLRLLRDIGVSRSEKNLWHPHR